MLDNGIELLIKILIYFHINKFNFITLNCLINKNLFDIFLFQNFGINQKLHTTIILFQIYSEITLMILSLKFMILSVINLLINFS